MVAATSFAHAHASPVNVDVAEWAEKVIEPLHVEQGMRLAEELRPFTGPTAGEAQQWWNRLTEYLLASDDPHKRVHGVRYALLYPYTHHGQSGQDLDLLDTYPEFWARWDELPEFEQVRQHALLALADDREDRVRAAVAEQAPRWPGGLEPRMRYAFLTDKAVPVRMAAYRADLHMKQVTCASPQGGMHVLDASMFPYDHPNALDDPSYVVRCHMARRLTAEHPDFAYALTHTDDAVRASLVHIPQAHEHLAADREARVRAIMATYPSTAPAVLERLSTDRNTDVRAAVASNRACPHEVAQKLMNDRERLVKEVATRTWLARLA
jgi:hypothetical protein